MSRTAALKVLAAWDVAGQQPAEHGCIFRNVVGMQAIKAELLLDALIKYGAILVRVILAAAAISTGTKKAGKPRL